MRGQLRILLTSAITISLLAHVAWARPKKVPKAPEPEAPPALLPESGNLLVDTAIEGATVEVDGKVVGVTPLPITALTPGNHTIKVSKRGFLALLDVVSIVPGLDSHFAADLFAEKAILKVTSPVEGAEVYVDGKLLGEVPLDVDIDPGRRSVRVSSQAYKDFVQVIEAIAGEEVKLDAPLVAIPGKVPPGKVAARPHKRWYKRWWVWAIAGGVVATAVIVPVAASSGGGSPVGDFNPDHTYDIH